MDVFTYESSNDSPLPTPAEKSQGVEHYDTIVDFGREEKIDLRTIDANTTTPGHDALQIHGLVNPDTFVQETKPGEVSWFFYDKGLGYTLT